MTTLLIDGDILAYRKAAVAQKTINWGDGDEPSLLLKDIREVTDSIDNWILAQKQVLKAHKAVVFLSDDDNWRKQLDPTYKANRSNVVRPELLQAAKDHLRSQWKALSYPRLEADDCMGIWSTEPNCKEKRIIVSQDKDMQSIPGWLFNPDKDESPRLITKPEADYYHTFQTLTGDTTDGYPGCPGIGPERAERCLRGMYAAVPHMHELKSGPRKGTQVVRWRDRGFATFWEVVLQLFSNANLDEKEAIKQARLARILRYGEYDFQTNKVKLWRPKEKQQ